MENNRTLLDSDYLEGKSEINLKDIFHKYLIRWQWIVAGLVLAITACHYYLKYTQPVYEASATVLIKDDSRAKNMDELNAFSDLAIINTKNNLENETEILKSRSLMLRTVSVLGLNVSYKVEHSPLNLELYQASPIQIHFTGDREKVSNMRESFTFTHRNNGSFNIAYKGKNVSGKYGVPLNAGFGPMVITAGDANNPYRSMPLMVSVTPLTDVAIAYAGKLKVEPVNIKSNVIRISMRDAVRIRAMDVINTLIQQYQADAIDDKNQVSNNTARFINDRISFITDELSEVEHNAENFKAKSNLLDIPEETKIFLSHEADINKELLTAGIQLQLYQYLNTYLQGVSGLSELLPTNLGLSDLTIESLIESHNKCVLSRNRMQKGGSSSNPVNSNLEDQILSLRSAIKTSLSNLTNTFQIKLNELKKQSGLVTGQIADVPRREREFREIQRQQQIKEQLYLYLLQKREETSIALAVTPSNAKVIDAAYSRGNIVSPNKWFLYMLSLVLGFFIPVAFIYVLDLFDTKVQDVDDLKKLNIPYLGYIPSSRSREKMVVKTNSRSVISEAFRSIRTNITFLLANKQTEGKVVFVTSSFSREGKTFVSINLACITAASGKKVLLMGLDLRKQNLLDYLGLTKQRGITDYLVNRDARLQDLIMPVADIPNLYVLPAGDTPPNPAELLMSDRMNEIFEQVRKEYDFVVVDTAPVALVSDTVIAAPNADAVLYIVRSGVTEKNSLLFPLSYYKEGKLPNMAFILNDMRNFSRYGYSYAYSYAYYGKEPKWWQKFLS